MGETTSFPISDPMSDIMLHAKDDLGLRRSHAVGRVILPLSTIVTPSDLSVGSIYAGLFRPLDRFVEATCKFLPVGVDQKGKNPLVGKLRAASKGIPGSGMQRSALVGSYVFSDFLF